MAHEVLQAELRREMRNQSVPTGNHGLGGRANLDDLSRIAEITKVLAQAQGALNDSEAEVNRRAEERMNQALAEAETQAAKDEGTKA